MNEIRQDEIKLVSNEVKKGFIGRNMGFENVMNPLEIFEQALLDNSMQSKHPFTCFGAIMNESNQIVTIGCLVARDKIIASCHNLLKYVDRDRKKNNQSEEELKDNSRKSLHFVSFLNQEQCGIIGIKYSEFYRDIQHTQEYNLAILELEEALGDTLGFLGVLANAKSDDFDIQTSQNPIIMLGLNANDAIEYQTTLAMDVTYNFLSVFNIIISDNIAFVNDPQYGYCVIGVSSKSTPRQTIINSINHEKIDLLFEWISSPSNSSMPISKARKYLDNKMRLQSKLLVGVESQEMDKDQAHMRGIRSIVRVNNNCFASVSIDGVVKMWNWKSGEQLAILSEEALDILKLQISGEFIVCLCSKEFFYFNWLTRRLDKHIPQHGSQQEFTSMCCLTNDMDILIGCASGQVQRYTYNIELKEFVYTDMPFDFESERKDAVRSILQVSQSELIFGLESGTVHYICEKNGNFPLQLFQEKNEQPILQILYLHESETIIAIAQDCFFLLHVERMSGQKLTLLKEVKIGNTIRAASALNEIEIAFAFDNSIHIFNTESYLTDKFCKDTHTITDIQMLNSEGFISGDDLGKIRAWIIGFTSSSPSLTPQIPVVIELDTIDELTEHSEDKSIILSQHSLHNFQSNSPILSPTNPANREELSSTKFIVDNHFMSQKNKDITTSFKKQSVPLANNSILIQDNNEEHYITSNRFSDSDEEEGDIDKRIENNEKNIAHTVPSDVSQEQNNEKRNNPHTNGQRQPAQPIRIYTDTRMKPLGKTHQKKQNHPVLPQEINQTPIPLKVQNGNTPPASNSEELREDKEITQMRHMKERDGNLEELASHLNKQMEQLFNSSQQKESMAVLHDNHLLILSIQQLTQHNQNLQERIDKLQVQDTEKQEEKIILEKRIAELTEQNEIFQSKQLEQDQMKKLFEELQQKVANVEKANQEFLVIGPSYHKKIKHLQEENNELQKKLLSLEEIQYSQDKTKSNQITSQLYPK